MVIEANRVYFGFEGFFKGFNKIEEDSDEEIDYTPRLDAYCTQEGRFQWYHWEISLNRFLVFYSAGGGNHHYGNGFLLSATINLLDMLEATQSLRFRGSNVSFNASSKAERLTTDKLLKFSPLFTGRVPERLLAHVHGSSLCHSKAASLKSAFFLSEWHPKECDAKALRGYGMIHEDGDNDTNDGDDDGRER
ncbi:hypothetical protein Tco_0833137 [Tanacetum coccineum]